MRDEMRVKVIEIQRAEMKNILKKKIIRLGN